ncbi:MAG: DUF1553 domain-containing protein, partial [Planctomycetales bacterium]|nr:DUF1553 domain-containing protein [Planctomycetales bacterium]
DDAARREKAASHDDFWQRRHQAAHDWANKHLQPHLAPSPGGSAAEPHPIDALIASKMNKAAEAAAATEPGLAEQFHSQVLPILSENCFRCHGEKQKGGLKLNSRDAALLGGESEVPAVVPGDPESSELLAQIRSGAMPPTETGLSSEQIAILERWIGDGAPWPAPPVAAEQLAPAPLLADEAFLRRIYLDIVGVPPTSGEARKFLQDSHPHKRQRLIDHLLQDPRLADHWVSYWQDLLAENPTLLNQSLNSTGPFRWFLYESLRDHKPLDRMITDLIMMRGSSDTGGSAGFALAAENDAPFAAKGHILAAAFLGVELQCARCHDSPFHSTLQRDLYSLAAMLERKSVTVPATSRVPQAFFDQKGRESLIQVTLKPDESIAAQWPFADVTGIADNPQLDPLLQDPSDTRERLAALLTAPNNLRFGRVMVNRVWQRLIGAGLVEPVDDWEGQVPSHPQLLDWLVYELLTHDYDLRHLIRQIVTSQVYMRQAHSRNLGVAAEQRFFNAPVPRRLTAEQIVDSLHVATGQSIDSEELTFVHDGQRPLSSRQTLGIPRRAWMFASLNNERDRPSLSLPRARTITDVLQAFGWNGARQEPVSQRDGEPNVLQPGILANGLLTTKLTRAAYRSEMAQLAVDADSPAWLVDEWFLRVLCRRATPAERATFEPALADGFEARLSDSPQAAPAPPEPLPQITWFNHLRPKANTIQQELERRAQQGPPPDPRLDPAWRAVYEDFVWSLINHREFVWLP